MGLIILSCTANDGKQETTYIPVGESADPDTEGWHLEPVARAAPIMDAGGADAGLIMPNDPSHVTLSFPRVAPGLKVALLSGKALPYEHQVSDTGQELTLTLFIPRDEELSIAVSPADEDGQVMGEPDYFVLRPSAKLGTHDTELDDSPLVISFQTGAENVLGLGENVLEKQATLEIVDGQRMDVMHGVFQTNRPLSCRVEWTGARKLYSMRNGPPECQLEPFTVQMAAGQTLGLYPVIEDMLDASVGDPVTIRLTETE